ncbi:hypothetical protein IFM89_009561 [Coptis chinensis]|uniref:RNA polymerase II-associated protein 3 n=1 Tax=Coptis chinensis TaxID=261450 RepID=A0A835M5D5_9MAGN|nr:hypothetical protein IFM89_009561 [Coptis chinensis]
MASIPCMSPVNFGSYSGVLDALMNSRNLTYKANSKKKLVLWNIEDIMNSHRKENGKNSYWRSDSSYATPKPFTLHLVVFFTMDACWASLPKELLELIALCLMTDVTDYVRFGVVWKLWWSVFVAIKPPRKLPPQIPWLLINDENLGKNSPSMFLLNPLTEAKIFLPPATEISWLVDYQPSRIDAEYAVELFEYLGGVVHDYLFIPSRQVTWNLKLRAELSSHPTLSSMEGDRCVVLLLSGLVRQFAFCTPGDNKWTTIVDNKETPNRSMITVCRDIRYRDGQFYVADRPSRVVVCDVGPPYPGTKQFATMNSYHQLYTENKHNLGTSSLQTIYQDLLTQESSPTAGTEKDLGNECFKQKKYNEAIDCYSRSIALSPTAVAFANRAMAYLKIKRFEEAENDCTEALNLDDRYTKAYSRRATARKELGKLKASLEDSEFSLRLEPQNQELKKQHAEAKAMYDKVRNPQEILLLSFALDVSNVFIAMNMISIWALGTPDQQLIFIEIIEEVVGRSANAGNRSLREDSNGSQEGATLKPIADISKNVHGMKKQEVRMSVQELASRAAARAMAEAGKSITSPKSAYQFEISWRGVSGDVALQARLLKAISPPSLPHLFKNSLSAALLIDIIKCIATFFREETELAVRYLDNLAKVPRFDLLIMCLSATDKSGM